MNNVLLILLSTMFNRDEVIKSLEADDKIDTWFYSFPNTIFVTTNLNPSEISRYIEEKFGSGMNFVTKIDDDYFGRMIADQWKHFNKVKYS